MPRNRDRERERKKKEGAARENEKDRERREKAVRRENEQERESIETEEAEKTPEERKKTCNLNFRFSDVFQFFFNTWKRRESDTSAILLFVDKNLNHEVDQIYYYIEKISFPNCI